jgi:hypothetical protein
MASAAPKFRHEDEGTSLPWKTPEDLDAQVESEGLLSARGYGGDYLLVETKKRPKHCRQRVV